MDPFGIIAHGAENANSEFNQTVKYGWLEMTAEVQTEPVAGRQQRAKVKNYSKALRIKFT